MKRLVSLNKNPTYSILVRILKKIDTWSKETESSIEYLSNKPCEYFTKKKRLEHQNTKFFSENNCPQKNLDFNGKT